MDNKIIAVDFDGTLCKNAWPKIGEPIRAWIDYVKEQQRDGAKLIDSWCPKIKDCRAKDCGAVMDGGAEDVKTRNRLLRLPTC